MLSQIWSLKSPGKVNSWGTHFQTTCSLIHSLSQHGSAAWSRAVRATFPLWAPPRKGKLPCNGLACLAVIWCHHCPRDEARAAQLCVTGFLYPADNGTSHLPPGLGACGRRRLFHIPADWHVHGCWVNSDDWSPLPALQWQDKQLAAAD